MSSVETDKYKNLIYFKPQLQPRDLLDQSIEFILSKLARIETKGTETNIPSDNNLVIGFLPHSGFLEPALVDYYLLMKRKYPAVWITKKESQDLPGFILSDRRFIYIDRENPEPSSVKTIYRVLETPKGTVATALEGTRFSNPGSEDDVCSLGKTIPGLMHIAYTARAPIMGVAILGLENVLPSLDKIIKEKGITEAFRLLVKGLIKPQIINMRFLPVYRDHLNDGGLNSRNKTRNEYFKWHNNNLTELLIEEILEIDPKYPLGFYQNGVI